MVIFINNKGNAEIVTPEQVYQGSNNVTDITVIAPFSPQTVMHIGFILPNELYWTSDDPADGGARYMPMTFVEQSMTTKANVWKYVLPFSVTKQAGKVQIALNAVSDMTTGGAASTTVKSNCTSYLCEFTVQESVLPNLPSAPDPSVYELLTQYLGVLQGRTAVIPSLVAGVEKTAPNAFRTVSLGGAKGAEIVLENDLGKPLAPIGAASTVYLDGTVFNPDSQIGTWVPVYDGATVTGYTAVIPAAMHAQMRDGATARDLWVGFDEQENNGFTGVYQGYTVNALGDITVSVKQPVAMNVRVWNGKGLSFTNIQSITPNGKDADGGNVYKILLTNGDVYYFTAPKGDTGKPIPLDDELSDTSENAVENKVITAALSDKANQDGNYPQMSVGQATNDSTGNNIAQAIQSIREDIQNESHFRGYLATNAEIQALSGTPNDFTYSAESGTVWIYQTETGWTNSNKPVPDQTVPASNTLPLSNGTANSGTSNAYARGDHVHPYITLPVYGVCNSSPSSALKTVSIQLPNFTLLTGVQVIIKFSNANSVGQPTLNVNNTGAIALKCDNRLNDLVWKAGEIMTLLYDGEYWCIISGYALSDKPVNTRIEQFWGESLPSVRFGGTWVIDTDYVDKVRIGSLEADIGQTGGSATHRHNGSTLIAHLEMTNDGIIFMDSIGESWKATYQVATGGVGSSLKDRQVGAGTRVSSYTDYESSLPPYKKSIIWKRTA